VFQLILPFQLELPFEAPRAAASVASRSHAMLRMAKPAGARQGGRGARATRSDRRKQASHSLELPLALEDAALDAIAAEVEG
jgi:hypothetical protein